MHREHPDILMVKSMTSAYEISPEPKPKFRKITEPCSLETKKDWWHIIHLMKAQAEMPFNELHDWKETRYAGIFPYLILLINKNQWVKLIMDHFGTAYKIFFVFLLMVARNVRSIECLKNVNYKRQD